jgi:hypothetical protein
MGPPKISIPAPPPPPPPPPAPMQVTIDEARMARDTRDESLRRRVRGRASTILTSPESRSQVQPETAARTLLG